MLPPLCLRCHHCASSAVTTALHSDDGHGLHLHQRGPSSTSLTPVSVTLLSLLLRFSLCQEIKHHVLLVNPTDLHLADPSASFNSRPAQPSLFLFLHTCAVAGDAPLMRVCVRWIDTLFCHGMCMASTWERTVIARSPIVRSPRKILSYNRTFQNGLLYSGPYHPIPLPPQLTPVV
jgi:hypothetical protein